MALGGLTVTVLVLGRVEVPDDLGSWAQGPLQGEVVLTLSTHDGAVVAGTRGGLYRLGAGATTQHDLGVEGPVHALVTSADGMLWAGTDEGASPVGQTGSDHALDGTSVLSLGRQGTSLLAGSDSGAWALGDSGTWERVWPPDGGEPARVRAVTGAPAGILLSHPDGLALLRDDGRVEIVVPGVDVVALGSWDGSGDLWAGTRGAPLLLTSGDGGLTWTATSDGLGFSALNAVAQDPTDPAAVMAGGSGLADGTGNAGTQHSQDAGRTWTSEQGRLTNTHIFALAGTTEPLRLRLRVTGTTWSTTVPLPVTTTRWYAGTNGAGVATLRPAVPALEALAATTPYLRLLEPLLAGLFLVVLTVWAYRHPGTARNPAQRGPPGTSPPPGQASRTGRTTTDHDNAGENS